MPHTLGPPGGLFDRSQDGWYLAVFGIVATILIVVLTVLTIHMATVGDSWMCIDGQWVAYGHPGGGAPPGFCIDRR